MNRSLYSGVSGLKAHQTRMDVIGNNIANVNTYGFKSSRVTFSDIYYQMVNSGNAGSSTKGGTNSGGIGYGTSVSTVDLLMGQSSFTMTDSTLDLAIDGEGFLQVQDADGNTFYTRAGALTFDSAGNLVDSQGNFVLGINGNPLGQNTEGNSIIQINLPSVASAPSAGSATINNIVYNIEATNASSLGNISMQIVAGYDMIDGTPATAEVGTSGIVVTLNSGHTFTSLADLNSAINTAIEEYMQANVGSSHPAGDFSITMDPAEWPAEGRTGEEICSTDFTMVDGKVENWPAGAIANGFKPTGETGADFLSTAGDNATCFVESLQFTVDGDGVVTVEFIITDGTTDYTYSGKIDDTKTETGSMKLALNGTSTTDYIVFNRPAHSNVITALETISGNAAIRDENAKTYTAVTTPIKALDGGAMATDTTTGTTTWAPGIATSTGNTAQTVLATAMMGVTPASESKALGLSGTKFTLGGGTEGGAQGIESLTGVAIGADGVIVGTHGELGEIVIGQICLVTFGNPEGLVQTSGTYFSTGPNCGEMIVCTPGQDGAGQLVSGSLELSNVDLSREFSDMITTQRGYQACSRLITVSDTMLEELVNLKR